MIKDKIIFLDIEFIPSITGCNSLEINDVVLVWNNSVVILIRWHYMCNLPVNLSSHLLNMEKKWFYLQ